MKNCTFNIWILFATLFSSCGSLPEIADSFSTLILANSYEVQNQYVLPGSYIVGFYDEGTFDFQRKKISYFKEYQSRYLYLLKKVKPHTSQIKMFHYLTSVPHVVKENKFQNKNLLLTRIDFRSVKDSTYWLKKWQKEGLFHFAEPNYISQLFSKLPPNSTGNLFQDWGTFYDENKISIPQIQNTRVIDALFAIGKRDINNPSFATDEFIIDNPPIVAVMDSGVDYDHPGIRDQMWQNASPGFAGCKDDFYGCNTTASKKGSLGNGEVFPFSTTGPGQPCSESDKDKNCSHGTHVAGIIAADPTLEGGTAAGVCPVCKIMAVKIVSSQGTDSGGILDSSIISGFDYIHRFSRGGRPLVRIVNCSFGKFSRSKAVGVMVSLLSSEGILIIGASGNEDSMRMTYPAGFSESIAVAALSGSSSDKNGKLSSSNFGIWVDIAAPGSDIQSLLPGPGNTGVKQGTSMATPVVAGIAGLLLAKEPDITLTNFKNAILQSANPNIYDQDTANGINFQYYYRKLPSDYIKTPLLGYGIIDALSLVNKEKSTGLPVYTGFDRVDSLCGVVFGYEGKYNILCLWFLFFIPFLYSKKR